MALDALSLNALRAFEAAARHGSFTQAAAELHVTPGALSHQIRGLEDLLGVRLFDRNARGIVLTPHGKALYPGLQAGFVLIRDAVGSLSAAGGGRILVVSTPPGFTSKWLAARLYRFAEAHPDIELRVASSIAYANFVTDAVDVAIRYISGARAGDTGIVYEKLLDDAMVPVCSPKLMARLGPPGAPDVLATAPLIHDDQLEGHPEVPNWQAWAEAAHMDVGGVRRGGLHFTSSDHALDAALEGAGVLLTHTILAYDDLLGGRLVMPFEVAVPSGRAYYFVHPKAKQAQRGVQAVRSWLFSVVARLDLGRFKPR